MPVGVGVAGSRGKRHRRRHRFQFHLDPGLLAGLLDDRLGFLARRVDRSLEYELQLLAVLGADAVRATPPSGLVQPLVRLVDVELPHGVFRNKAWGIVDEITGRDPGAAIDMSL